MNSIMEQLLVFYRLGRGKYSFGVGPRHDPWFDFDFSWGGSSKPWWHGYVCFNIKQQIKSD